MVARPLWLAVLTLCQVRLERRVIATARDRAGEGDAGRRGEAGDNDGMWHHRREEGWRCGAKDEAAHCPREQVKLLRIVREVGARIRLEEREGAGDGEGRAAAEVEEGEWRAWSDRRHGLERDGSEAPRRARRRVARKIIARTRL